MQSTVREDTNRGGGSHGRKENYLGNFIVKVVPSFITELI